MSTAIFSTISGRLALLAVLGLAAHAGAGDGPARLKAAARAQVAKASPTMRLDHVEISRIVDGYAVVTVYPDMKKNPTDPAKVILHREGGIWKAIAGPGTAFPPGSRPAAPGALFELESPYTGESARKAIQRLNVGRKRFKNTRVTFQYPADAVVEAQRGEVRLVGPRVREPAFSGPAYEIAITPLATVLKGTLDEWGYARMQGEVRKREAENGRGGPNTQPQAATFFHLPRSDAFQIDWFAGDSTIREFYVVPKGGGRVVKFVTRVYPIQNNPAAPRAESAINLVLQTLEPAPPGAAARKGSACIVTADEIPDPSTLRMRLLLNGQVMQDRTNEDWVFPLPRLLAWLSSAMTLEPCSRGNRARAPICVLEIDRIGRLENPVVSIG